MRNTYRANNTKITATITKPPMGDGMGPPKMLVHIPKKFRIKAGSVLFTQENEPTCLLAYHHNYGDTVVFTGFPINTQIELQKTEEVRHGVTNKVSERRPLGPVRRLWVCEDVITPDQVLGLNVSKRVFYVGTEVLTTDTINGMRVKDVLETNGIWRVEVA